MELIECQCCGDYVTPSWDDRCPHCLEDVFAAEREDDWDRDRDKDDWYDDSEF